MLSFYTNSSASKFLLKYTFDTLPSWQLPIMLYWLELSTLEEAHTTFLAVTCYWLWLPALEKKHVAEVAVASYYFCSQLHVNLSLFFLSIFASFKMTVLLLISSTVWIWNNSRILPNFHWKLFCFPKPLRKTKQHFIIGLFLFFRLQEDIFNSIAITQDQTLQSALEIYVSHSNVSLIIFKITYKIFC